MEVHEKGPKAPKSVFLQHPSAFTPSWPEGKRSFLVMGFGIKNVIPSGSWPEGKRSLKSAPEFDLIRLLAGGSMAGAGIYRHPSPGIFRFSGLGGCRSNRIMCWDI